MSKLISYSLYGTNPKYLRGAIKNSLLAKEFFSEWTSRFYCGSDVPRDVLRELEKLGSQVLLRQQDWHSNGMFWRYLAVKDTIYDYTIFRDVDSRFTSRDVDAITQWIESKRSFHIVRDHPFHMTPILGGLFGLTNSPTLRFLPWNKCRHYGTNMGEDQKFLTKWIYPQLNFGDVLVHDNFFCFEKEKVQLEKSKDYSYLGESYDENENHSQELRSILANYSKSIIKRQQLRAKSFLISKFPN